MRYSKHKSPVVSTKFLSFDLRPGAHVFCRSGDHPIVVYKAETQVPAARMFCSSAGQLRNSDIIMIVLGLIVHLMLGYRRLRDMEYYRDDLMVLRLLGLEEAS